MKFAAQRDADRMRHGAQFSLRTLMIVVTCCAVLVAVLQHVDVLWRAAILWFLALAAAHVFGNVWGSRAAHDGPPDDEEERERGLLVGPRMCVVRYARATRLRHRCGPGRWLLHASCGAGLCGSAVCMVGLAVFTRSSASGILLGSLSAAILCGLLAFATLSFAIISGRALREAAR